MCSSTGTCTCDNEWTGALCDVNTPDPCGDTVGDAIVDACEASGGAHNTMPAAKCDAACAEEFTLFYADCLADDVPGGDPSTDFYNLCLDALPVPPSTPAAPTLSVSSSSKIVVSWTAPQSNYLITEYNLEYRTTAGTVWESENTASTSFAVNGLDTNVMYTFRVSAYSDYGWSDVSTDAQATTLPSKPGQPRNLAAPIVSSSSITLSWDPPLLTGGYDVDRYLVQAAQQVAGTTVWGKVWEGLAVTVVLSNLNPSTTYYYRVMCKTTPYTDATSLDSYGPVSSDLAVTTSQPAPPAAPSVTFGTITHESIVCQWAKPYVASAASLPALEYELTSEGDGVRLIQYTGTELSYAVSGLTAASKYEFRTRVRFTGGSWSSSSAFTASTTFATVPGAPSAPVSSTVTDSSIRITWTAPADDGGSSISAYRVCGFATDCTKASIGATSYTATQLSTGTPYAFTVQAMNGRGWGDLSNSTTISTLAQTPSISSLVASGGTTDKEFNADDQITVSFDLDTNQVAVATKANIDALFSFSVSIGDDYTGTWTSTNTTVITITDPGTATPQIGKLTVSVQVSANLKNAAETSGPCGSHSGRIIGNWGSISLGDYIDLASSVVGSEDNDLAVVASLDEALTATDYTLVCTVYEGQLTLQTGSTIEVGPTQVLTLTGSVSSINSQLLKLVYRGLEDSSASDALTLDLNSGDVFMDSKSQSISLSPVNDAPTIARPQTFLAAEDTFTKVSGVSVADVDNSGTEKTQISVSLWSAGSLKYTQRVSDLVSFPGYGVATGYGTLTLSGTVAQVNSALASLHYQNPSGKSSPQSIIIEASDDSLSAESRSIAVSTPCANLRKPSALSVVWTDEVNAVELTFSHDLTLDAEQVNCASIFDASTLTAFGSGVKCKSLDSRTFKVDLPYGSTLAATADVSVLGGFKRCATGQTSQSAQLQLALPANPPLPVAVLSAPSTIGLCDDLALDASASYNLLGREGVFVWSSAPSILGSYASGTDMITVSAFDMEVGVSYTFCVSVQNFLGTTSKSSCVTVTKSGLQVPSVSILGEQARSVDPSTTVSAEAEALLSACLQGSERVLFEWTASPAVDLGRFQFSRVLSISPDTFVGGSTYTLTVSATMESDSTLTSTAMVTVEALATPPVAVIIGSTQQISKTDALEVDASASESHDGVLEFFWMCTIPDLPGENCFDANTGDVLALSDAPILSLPAASLNTGSYEFTVEVVSSGGYDIASQVVNVVPTVSLKIKIGRHSNGGHRAAEALRLYPRSVKVKVFLSSGQLRAWISPATPTGSWSFLQVPSLLAPRTSSERPS